MLISNYVLLIEVDVLRVLINNSISRERDSLCSLSSGVVTDNRICIYLISLVSLIMNYAR